MAKIDDIKKIREMTGVSVDAIKTALEEAEGQIEKALEVLKKRGAAVAQKKSGRQTGEGLIFSYVHANGKIGVLLTLLCETDFVAKNEQFKQLGRELAMHVAAMNPKDIDELVSQPYVRDQNVTVDFLIKDCIGKIGENIRVGEFYRIDI